MSVPSLAEIAQQPILEEIAESDDGWQKVVIARKEKKKRELQQAETAMELLKQALDQKREQVKKLKRWPPTTKK